MKLKDRLMQLSSIESNWGIWAEAPFSENSDSRVGQIQFENGGLLDDKQPVGTLESLTREIEGQIDDEDGDLEYQREVAVETLIGELEEERHAAEEEKRCTCGTGDTSAFGDMRCDCPGYCTCQSDMQAYADDCPVHHL